MFPLDPATIALLAAASVALVLATRTHTVRGGLGAKRSMQRGLRDASGRVVHGHSLHHLVAADAINRWKLRRLRSRAEALRPVALGAVRQADDQQRIVADAEDIRDNARDECADDPTPVFTGRIVALASSLLLLGDIAIVATAIMASNRDTTLLLAVLATFALSMCLFVVGKAMGDKIRDIIDTKVQRWLAGTGG